MSEELNIPTLISFLSNSDPSKRAWAAEQLGRFGVKTALSTLLPLLSDTNDEVRASATFAVSVIAGDLWETPAEYYAPNNQHIVEAHKLIKEVVIPNFLDLLSDPNPDVRFHAILGLQDTYRAGAISQVAKLIFDPNIQVRLVAIRFFQTINSPDISPYLTQLLSDPLPEIKIAALNVLEMSKKSKLVIPYVAPLIFDENIEVRVNAIMALGNLKAKQVIPNLIQLLSDPNKNIRWVTIDALEKLEVKKAIPKLINLLPDSDSDIRLSIVRALGTLGNKKTIPTLIKATKDQDFMVRYCAIEALERVGNVEALSALENVRDNDNDQKDGLSIKEIATTAINEIKGRFSANE